MPYSVTVTHDTLTVIVQVRALIGHLGRWCTGSIFGSNPKGQGSIPWRPDVNRKLILEENVMKNLILIPIRWFRKLWSEFYAAVRDLGVVWLILLLALIAIIVLSLITAVLAGVLGLPALLLYLAWNWVVPVFGGPTIEFWTAVGMYILVAFVCGIVSVFK